MIFLVAALYFLLGWLVFAANLGALLVRRFIALPNSFDRLSEIGAALEQAAKGKDVAAIRAGREKLAEYLARVEAVYEEL